MDRGCPIRSKGSLPVRMVVVGVFVCHALAAGAAEMTRVASGFEEGKRFPVDVSVSWLHDQKQAIIKRESASAGSTSQIQLVKDLIYHQSRDIMNVRLEMGILRDVGLHIDLPYVLRDDRDLDFDQSAGSPCVPSSDVGKPNCSTLIRDGILPGAGQLMYGVDATAGGRSFAAPSSSVWKGPRRSGLESLGIGVSGAIMSQARDDTKPTWTMGLDAQFDVGTTMRYDAGNPGENTAVGLGYHQLVASTFASKRVGAMDPYFGVAYLLPLAIGGGPFDKAPTGSQPYAGPQSRLAVQFGFEFVAWERPEMRQRVSLVMRTRGDHRFRGSGHSELWEPLSGAQGCGTPSKPACRPGLDFDEATGQASPHPGVTETQGYSSLGGDVGLDIQVGRHARFRGLFGLTADLPHFITSGSAGSDRNGDGRVDSSDVKEANPAYREIIDIPGRRFKVDGTQVWNVLVEASAMF